LSHFRSILTCDHGLTQGQFIAQGSKSMETAISENHLD